MWFESFDPWRVPEQDCKTSNRTNKKNISNANELICWALSLVLPSNLAFTAFKAGSGSEVWSLNFEHLFNVTRV